MSGAAETRGASTGGASDEHVVVTAGAPDEHVAVTGGVSDARVAVAAARAGAAVVREMYGAALTRYEKGAGDFATAADLAAEKAILDVLRTARPDDAVTGEESGRTGPVGASRRWLVDPLCGTLNYAVHNMLVGVNVALRVGPDITVAATADPFSGEVFWTDGERARVQRPVPEGDLERDGVGDGAGEYGEELTPSAASRLVDLNLDPPFPNAPDFSAARLLTAPGFTEHFRPRVVSTTLAVAWVAAGRRAAYVTDGHLRDSVHFAAGIALCRASGCVVTGIHGQPPHTGAGGLVAAADEQTHARLLELIARQATADR
ncbi:inositol monophosphatase family protein [Streptomyces sp. NA04227]|uniref:inositol monophosphatase family protein n=1 Tax=Streptomyces sp. NA04227 TaxID=2742136 RepID=UPI0015909BA9|nr:inositol monophosphatase family protein [Streptomyces sp. NA04227]QKW09137.1 inositol monophosphatase family protein [Streptomyces sp. NA04227]